MADGGELRRDFITPRELAATLGVSLRFIHKHTHSGRMPGAVKIGRCVRYRRAEIERRLLNGQLLLEDPEKARC